MPDAKVKVVIMWIQVGLYGVSPSVFSLTEVQFVDRAHAFCHIVPIVRRLILQNFFFSTEILDLLQNVIDCQWIYKIVEVDILFCFFDIFNDSANTDNSQ